MKSTNTPTTPTLPTTASRGQTPTPQKIRPMRSLCGLAMAAVVGIGLSAPLASAEDIAVQNGGFEDPTPHNPNDGTTADWTAGGWAFVGSPWTTSTGNYGRLSQGPVASPQLGDWMVNLNDAGGWVKQDLGTTVNAGDTLSVTFEVMSDTAPGEITAAFLVGGGPTEYSQTFSNPQNSGTWVPYTLTKTIGVSGNLSLRFRQVSGRLWLDNISHVSVTPGVINPNAPSSTDATLVADEDAPTALAASDFGYSDPNSDLLAAVKITSLPALGTLKLNGTPVVSGNLPLTVAAANIGNLTYQSALNENGTSYTIIGIAVQDSTGLWSLDTVMTVNVTPVNDPPTSTGGSVILKANTVNTFAAEDFQFSDVDAGDTLDEIKVTLLPVNGTLNLYETPISANEVVSVYDLWALTYSPATDYTGSDSFDFQVSDGTDFSTDATMAITVTSDILVQNGSFETPGGIVNATYWRSLGSPWTAGASSGYEQLDLTGWEGATFSSAADGVFAANMETWILSITQDLVTDVNAGDTLSVTFSGGRAKGQLGGKFTATFVVGGTEYTSREFDTGLLAEDTWNEYTFTTPITNTGNLSLKFSPVSDRPWLDKVSNISVTTGSGFVTYADWATTNSATGQSVAQDHDHDGVPNGIEYFLGGSGDTTGFTPLPGVLNTAGALSVTWIKAVDYPGVYGTDYVVETSTTLTGTWTDEPGSGAVSISGNHVTYTFPAGPVKKFARLKVMGTP